MSRWLKAVFVISIILNFLFVGLTIGHFSKRVGHFGKMKADVTRTIGELPEDKRRMIMSAMRELRQETRGTKREVDELRREIIDTLTAESFDAEKFETQALELHELHGVLSMEMTMTVAELAENLNQEEREALAQFIREMRKHRRPHGGPPGRRPHGPPGEGFGPPGPPGERF